MMLSANTNGIQGVDCRVRMGPPFEDGVQQCFVKSCLSLRTPVFSYKDFLQMGAGSL